MAYEVNFGSMRVATTRPGSRKSGNFRIAVLGDFSARSNSGKLETDAKLAARKPLRVDCDNLDATLKRFDVKLKLPLGAGGIPVELAIGNMDDLHPDQLYGSLPIFSELSSLRQRLKNNSTFAKAAQEVQSWTNVAVQAPLPSRPRSTVIPANARLSDFARLVGKPSANPKTKSSVAELLKQVVAPYVVPAKDPRQDRLVATVDSALAATMRAVLHHPDFQSFESLWRSVDFLVRRLETDERLQIVLYDVSAEEFAADLSKGDDLENTGLYKLLVEQPSLDADQGPFGAVIANYMFEQTPPHAELLGRMARIAGQSRTAFLAGIGTNCLETKPANLHRLIREAWDALAEMPEAAYLGLVVPRFMLRMPYGERTDPIDSFDFEEFTPQIGLGGMLWGNAAVLAGFLLGKNFQENGLSMDLTSTLGIGDMPFYYYTDSDGDQTALPCTERMVSSKTAELVLQHRYMPLLALKGRNEVRLGGFGSVAGVPLAGPWQPVGTASSGTKSQPTSAKKKSEPQPEPEPEPEAETGESTTAEKPSEPLVENAEPAPADAVSQQAEEPAVDPELDRLLADLDQPAPIAATPEANAQGESEPPMDPELAKLLADLG